MMIDQPGDPVNPNTYRPRSNEGDLYDAAWNAVAIASTHWQQSTAALRNILARGQVYGLSTLELCTASGLDEDSVTRMIDEADV
jgi:hypothetical protein